MKINFYGKSDKGKIRRDNEDYFVNEKISDNEYIFVVADGMGGHKAGEVASKLGTQTFINQYKNLREKKTSINASINISAKKANKAILTKALSDPGKRGMGTTFSTLVISDMKAHIIHIGDSRIYLIRNDKIKRMTRDHTFVEKMVEEGRISENEARDHPQKNILYMSLGARESFDPDVIENFELKDGDVLFMCSDGLNSVVTDNFIKEYSQSYHPDEAVDKLIQLANDNGGTDNITIQIIRIGQIKNLNKTEPIKIKKINKKMVSLFFIFTGLLLILLALWIFFL